MIRMFTAKKMAIGAALFVAVATSVALPSPAKATVDPFSVTPPGSTCTPAQGVGGFFGFPTWYKYLKGETVTDANNAARSVCRPRLRTPSDIWLVVAAFFEILLRVSTYAAVAFVIYGAFTYIISRGTPERINNARDTIINAITGLVITVVSGRILGFIAGRISGNAPASALFLPNVGANSTALTTILSTVFQLAGALSVVFVVWGGLTYARASGDPSTVKQAKDTILYALIGLAICVFAVGLIEFVFERLI